jgi:hypothetical protein
VATAVATAVAAVAPVAVAPAAAPLLALLAAALAAVPALPLVAALLGDSSCMLLLVKVPSVLSVFSLRPPLSELYSVIQYICDTV